MLISGDMLLPRISTNVSVFAATPHDDPLGRFLLRCSATKFARRHARATIARQTFPGNRCRVAQLIDHHAARCDELLCSVQRNTQCLRA